MTTLRGDTPYEKVNHATGRLASKIQQLIEQYEGSPSVSKLADEFISWWYMPFDHPDKDPTGRAVWDKADRIKAALDGCEEADQSIHITKLEKAGIIVGNAIGSVIGKAPGVTANVTISGAKIASRWLKDIAAPAVKAGGNELWKGLRATARATGEAYHQSRANSKPVSNESDDGLPY